MRRLVPAIGIALACALPARATTFSVDVSDLWWNQAESGWGVNLIQQDNLLFATLFVYESARQPFWFVGSALASSGPDASGNLVFSGPWYQTSGPYYGGAFNPASVGTRAVGTATFTLYSGGTSGTLAYTIEGTTITKNVTRQTWRANNLAGSYIGAQAGRSSGCPNAVDNAYREATGPVTVTHSPSSFSISAPFGDSTCTFLGGYTQSGRIGMAIGNFTCANSQNGAFTLSELESSVNGLGGRLNTSQSNGCQYTGRITAIRRQQ